MSAVIGTIKKPVAGDVAGAAIDETVALPAGDGGRALALDGDGLVSLDQFQRQVRALAARLPAGRHAINLCEDRYRFLVAFCAVAVRGQVTLLPPSRAPAVIADELQRHADSYCLGDGPLQPEPPRYWQLPGILDEVDGEPVRIDPRALAAIGFTLKPSGFFTRNPALDVPPSTPHHGNDKECCA